MLSLAQSLTLSDFHQMYAIERAYYDPRYITPPQEAFRWYQAYPLSTLAVKEGEMVAGFLNLFPVRPSVFAQLLAGTFNDREMELCQLADPFSGTGTLHMFLCCIARRLDYQGQGVGGLLLKAGVEAYRTVAHRCGAIITDGTKNYYCKSINVAINSTVGAGDGMVAAASMMLEQGAPLDEILRAGVAAGTATVTTFGSISFTKEKYDEIYANLKLEEF